MLDEPTNFLDKEHVEWLANYLMNFEGAFIVVSHDFDFLEKVTSCICDVEFGTVKVLRQILRFCKTKGAFAKRLYSPILCTAKEN